MNTNAFFKFLRTYSATDFECFYSGQGGRTTRNSHQKIVPNERVSEKNNKNIQTTRVMQFKDICPIIPQIVYSPYMP